MPRPVRTLVVALVALASWLVAGSAFAAAPMCDDRGASAFAPPPTLDAPAESIDVGLAQEACGFGLDEGISLHQGRAADPQPAPAEADLLPVSTRARVIEAAEESVPPPLAWPSGPTGVRSRLERPPR